MSIKRNRRFWVCGDIGLFPASEIGKVKIFNVLLNDDGSTSSWSCPRYDTPIGGRTEEEVAQEAFRRYGDGHIVNNWDKLF